MNEAKYTVVRLSMLVMQPVSGQLSIFSLSDNQATESKNILKIEQFVGHSGALEDTLV